MATILPEYTYTFDDVLLRPQFSSINSRDVVNVETEVVSGYRLGIPIMSSNMQTVNSVELAIELSNLGGMATADQFRSIDLQVDFIRQVKKRKAKIAGAVGASRDYIERTEAIIAAGIDILFLDTPHAHNALTLNAVKDIRKKHKDFPFIVGNVATKEAAELLIEAGVDGLKVGVGPGAACTTRVNTGAGMAQISAIMECYAVAKKHGIKVIADGGVKTPGSFAKAIAAGGDIVYMGSVFAGSFESPSKLVEINGQKYKEFYGSSSVKAKINRASADKNFKESATRYVEGGEGLVNYQGTVKDIVERYVMGLRSGMSYSGAQNIAEFHEKAIFSLLTNNGVVENGAHGLVG